MSESRIERAGHSLYKDFTCRVDFSLMVGPNAPVDHGIVAVTIPFVLPQVAVKSGHKLAAENEIEHVQRQVIFVAPGDGQVAGANHRLGRAWLVGNIYLSG